MISTVDSNTNRISGLMSGMDTESMVKAMTSGTSTKLNQAKRDKILLEWKQDAYRTVTQKLYDFNSKYFGSKTGHTSIGDSLKQLTATSSQSQYVEATSSLDSVYGSIYIADIQSLATKAKLQSAGPVSTGLSAAVDPAFLGDLSGKSVVVNLDGVNKTITFSDKTYSSAEDVAAELQTRLDAAFGSGRILASASDGVLSLSASGSELQLRGPSSAEDSALPALGFKNGASNNLNLSDTLADLPISPAVTGDNISFSINGVDFSFAATATLSSVISTVNASDAGVTLSFSDISDTFTMTASETGSGGHFDLEDTEGSFLSSILGGGRLTAGRDAVVRVGLNGGTDEEDLITLTRSSNSFTINGTSITLKGMAAGDEAEKVDVKVDLDIETVIGKIKSFISDYNTLVSDLDGYVNAKSYTGFYPLTDDDKENLTDKEQEDWTEKAKSGILKNDTNISTILSGLRSAMYAPVKDVNTGGPLSYIISDIGITTEKYAASGKLTIDEDALRRALTKDPETVLSLLQQNSSVGYSMYNSAEKKTQRYNESGLIWRMNDIVKNNISWIGKKGPLVELVGSPENGFSGINTYTKKLADIENTISSLTQKLSDEEDRYWSKFSAMETTLSSLNASSLWLTNQSSSS